MEDPRYTNDDTHDLARFDEAFVSASTDDEDVPDGKWQVNIEKAELVRSQTSGNPMLKWTLRVLGPDHVGRLLWRNNMLVTDENIRWLKTDLKKAGLEIAKASDLPSSLDRLLDVKLLVTKKTNGEFTNIYINRRLTESEVAAASGTSF